MVWHYLCLISTWFLYDVFKLLFLFCRSIIWQFFGNYCELWHLRLFVFQWNFCFGSVISLCWSNFTLIFFLSQICSSVVFFLWFFLFVLYLLFYIVKFILAIQLYFCLKKQCENKYYKCQCKSITQTPCINHFFQFKGTLMQIWKSPYILYSYKNNTIKISHSESQGFLKYLPVKFVNFLKSRLIFNIVYCFWVFVNKLFTYLTCSYLKK